MYEKICTRCMIPDYADEEQFIRTYVDSIDPDLKTSEEVYQQRLRVCLPCRYYLNGMCRLCGCFVAVRAAVKIRRCPDQTDKWLDSKESVS